MNKVSRRQAKREEWLAHVAAWRRSGDSQVVYCRVHGLVPETFSAWVARVRKMCVDPTKPLTMVPVVVQPGGVAVQINSPLRLQHRSGGQLDLPAGTAADWVGKVLKELG